MVGFYLCEILGFMRQEYDVGACGKILYSILLIEVLTSCHIFKELTVHKKLETCLMGCDVLFQMPHLKDNEAAFGGNVIYCRMQKVHSYVIVLATGQDVGTRLCSLGTSCISMIAYLTWDI